MSIHGLVCSPSTLHFSTQELPSSRPSFSPPHNSARLTSLHVPPTISLRSSSPLLRFSVTPKIPAFHALQSTAPFSETIPQTDDEQSSEAPGNRVLAQNVPWNSTADDLRPLFEKYGTVVDIQLSMYNKTRNRGLAFVTMGSHEEALAALTNLDSYEFEGRILKLNWATPKKTKKPLSPPAPKPVYNLFVANLPYQARAKDIREFFNADNGNVASAEVIFLENPRRAAGYGFVSFNTKEEAEAALHAFDGKEFMGRPIRVARSKIYLRGQTKLDIESQSAPSSESNSEGES